MSVRRNAGSAMAKAREYTCPVCQYQKVERQSVGIWSCKKCDHTFAGWCMGAVHLSLRRQQPYPSSFR